MKDIFQSVMLVGWALVILCGCDQAPQRNQLGTVGAEAMEEALVIINNLDEMLSVLDGDGQMHNQVQYTGNAPNDIVADADRLCIVNSLSNSILVLDSKTLAIEAEIAVGSGKNPYHAALVKGGVLAVTGLMSGTLDIVDIDARRLIASVDLRGIDLPSDPGTDHTHFCYPHGVAVNNGLVFVTLANLTNDNGGLTAAGPSVVAVIDAEDLHLVETIELMGHDAVAALSVGSKVIVVCAGHYTGSILSIDPGGFDGDGSLAVIDAGTLALEQTYRLPDTAPFSATVSDEMILYTSNALDTGIARVDILHGEVLSSLPFASPYIADVCAAGEYLYALDFTNDRLYVLDSAGALQGSHLTGDGPLAMLKMGNLSGEASLAAALEVNPGISSPGMPVTFDASRSLVATGSLCCSWDFGDGESSEGVTVTHAYAAEGTYTARLCVSATDGQTDCTEVQLEVILESPFAVELIDFDPAPGQFVDNPLFSEPLRALGAPVGAGTSWGDATSQVSLGGFGGSITLGFDHRVQDDPDNPLGLDCIVFGNAFGSWGEPGVIEISDDLLTWFLIPGSALKPGQDPAYARVSKTYAAGGTYSGYLLPESLQAIDPCTGGPPWGYADITPVMALEASYDPLLFFTCPDNPFTAGVTSGGCGGDAFDIAWAVDPETGASSGLDGFSYIRITTGMDIDDPLLGEKSTEIDAVADVKPGG